MAFSFNPTQTPGSLPQSGGPQINIQSPGGSTQDAPPSIPDSPFLFMRNRDKEMTINAYLQLLLMLIAALSAVTAIVIFVYAQYLSMQADSKKAELTRREATFKSYPFDDMKSLSDRFIALDKILKGYISSRSPLNFLERVVEKQVFFNDFSFTNNEKGGMISFTIVTGSQKALIQQLDSLNLKKYSTVVPNPKMDSFSDTGTFFKAKVSAPVLVQGILSDEVLLILDSSSTKPQ